MSEVALSLERIIRRAEADPVQPQKVSSPWLEGSLTSTALETYSDCVEDIVEKAKLIKLCGEVDEDLGWNRATTGVYVGFE